MSLALSICVLFILITQSVNGAQFLIHIFFPLFGFAAVPLFRTIIFGLTSIYASHKLDFNSEVLNLI